MSNELTGVCIPAGIKRDRFFDLKMPNIRVFSQKVLNQKVLKSHKEKQKVFSQKVSKLLRETKM